jgi:aminopeptidase
MPRDLGRALDTIMERSLDIRHGEQVLVIGDYETQELAQAMRAAAARHGADAVLTLMDPRANDGTEPPASVAAAMLACDAFLAPTSRSLSHTRARKASNDGGARGATLPGATAEMIGRVMSVDFEKMKARTVATRQLLDEADEALITCANGSELRIDLTGRHGYADIGEMTRPGTFGNLPAGEAFASPLSGSGTLAASSLAPLGISPEPVLLTVEDGHLTAANGPLGPEFLKRLVEHGPSGTNIAELGIGTNDCATLTGNILEDEKILGTVHVAFGASMGIGGTVSVPIHLDVVVLEPTLTVGATQVLDAGRWVL